uniref:DUF192 domain-containing protein n=1 Tax=Parerythrobacter lutipelagi TaxID=1964208 RepID=UPI0010F7DD91|nr:DUF192 domain-containing protein [Parerythrobacter lutipelagi]
MIARFAALLAASLFLIACSPQQSADRTSSLATETPRGLHPESGLKVIPLTVTSGTAVHSFQVEVAASAEEQRKGLMFRARLGPNEGMIFPRNPPDLASFWMKNTPLPLDIIFVGEDRKILNIAANTVPYSLDSVPAAGLTALVLEIPGGRAAELGIEPGDSVEW